MTIFFALFYSRKKWDTIAAIKIIQVYHIFKIPYRIAMEDSEF